MLSLQLLGPMQVTLDGTVVTAFEYDKVRALLAYLAVEGDRAHRRETLMGLLWPDLPEASARMNLRQALATLRRAIGDRDADPPTLLATRESVQWAAGANSRLDVAEYCALLDESERHRHRHADQCHACANRYEQAVTLYRGAFLAQFSLGDSVDYEEWALLKREWLHHRQLNALERLVAYYERRGDYARSIAYARRQLELDGWREECHRHLMALLVLNGERGAALEQYERCRALLESELGVEPEAETTALYQQIHGKSPDAPVAMRALRAGGGDSQNLPPPLTPFVGREAEVEQLTALLDDPACRLVTLVGIGGIGKTRLALQAAQAQAGTFADGLYWLPLAAVGSAERLPRVIGDALGLVFGGTGNAAEQLISHVRNKEMLLVLDNFEHLAEAAPFVADLLAAAPDVNLLVTSRGRLHLQGEWVVEVKGLELPEAQASAPAWAQSSAVELFLRAARRAGATVATDEAERAAITRICILLEGMPLGIELAAAWARALPCAEIAAEIERDMAFLASTLHDTPARHRSIHAVFDHSWRLLSGEEQRLLAALSLFRGSFRRDAAEAVADATLPLLSALLDKSLLRRDPSGRYDLHELVRQYAAGRLEASGNADAARAATLHYFLELALHAEAHYNGAEQAIWLERVGTEHDNLVGALEAALGHGATEAALSLAVSLYRYWHWRTFISEGRHWLEATLAATEPQAEPLAALRARAFHAAGVLADEQGDYTAAITMLTQALALRQGLGDVAGQAATLNSMGVVAWEQQELEKAAGYIEASLTLRRGLGSREGLASPLNNLGLVALAHKDFEKAQGAFEEVLEIDRGLGNQIGIAGALVNLGTLMLDRGAPETALPYFRESLALYRGLGEQEGIAYCLEGIAGVLATRGDVEAAREAARHFGAAAALRTQLQMPLSAAERGRYEEHVALVRATLGDEEWDRRKG